jgi:hypothetical protein
MRLSPRSQISGASRRRMSAGNENSDRGVESKRWGWMAITKPSDRIAHPDCAKRVAQIEAELRVMFDLVDD